jgi:CheY-like chemotaxis protein
MAEPAPGSSNETTVLVVSDDPIVREQARFGFPAGVRVSFANDSRDAWTSLRAERPTLVVVDMQTGNAGGYGLSRDMAQTERLRAVPVLILLERAVDAWLAHEAGASAYLTKPLGPAELPRAVTSLLASQA